MPQTTPTQQRTTPQPTHWARHRAGLLHAQGERLMKVSTAFAPLTAAAAGFAMSHNDTTALTLVLIVIALYLVGLGAFVVLYVCLPADRKDLRKLIRAWRAR